MTRNPTSSEKPWVNKKKNTQDIEEYRNALKPHIISWFKEQILNRGIIVMRLHEIAVELGEKFTHKSYDTLFFALRFTCCYDGIKVTKVNNDMVSMEFYDTFITRFKVATQKV